MRRKPRRAFADGFNPSQPRGPDGKWVSSIGATFSAIGENRIVVANLGVVRQAGRITKLTGVDVRGFRHGLSNQAMSHILRSHGTAKELSHGQKIVSRADFSKVGEVVRRPDDIQLGTSGFHGQKRLIFNKKIGPDTYTYIAEVRRGKRRIDGITMWKK